MLDIKQPIIARDQSARFGVPGFGPRVGRVDTDVDDLRHFQTPLPDDLEAALIPTRIPSERAYSSASKFRLRLTRFRYVFKPSSSIASRPRNIYCRPRPFQNSKTSLLRSSTSPRVSR